MNKRKKVLVVITILSSLFLSFISGQSYSKYMSEIRGNAVADIATWSFKVNGSTEERQTIPLTLTSYSPSYLAENKIAPGTEGSFNIVVDGTESDVGIRYTVRIENPVNVPKNLLFTYAGNEYPIDELDNIFGGIMNVNDTRCQVFPIRIDWKWKYETGRTAEEKAENDRLDTQDVKNISQCSFDVVVKAEQLEPVES